MIEKKTEELYKNYLSQAQQRWVFGNSILYQMCAENPGHDQTDIIVGKLWLIGRSYAAAIERRKTADGYQGDDFYYEVVAPKMLEIGKELDARLAYLNNTDKSIKECIPDILETHRFLMDAFTELTGLEKRSLASKYLHFHCPDKFYIYDSRARGAIDKLVKRPDKEILFGINKYDAEYGDFVCRMLELQEYFEENLGIHETPRGIDNFLLMGVE